MADGTKALARKGEVMEAAPVDAGAPAARQDGALLTLIERVVTSPDVPIEKLERLLDMQERIEHREARRAFDHAIALAKAEIPPIIKTQRVDYVNRQGARTRYEHEDLASIARTIDPILTQHGLSYRYRSHQEGGQVRVTCIVSHRDGYSEETTLSGEPDTSGSKNGFQAVGSAATYLQRYTLKLALGLSAAKDDDATGANPNDAETIGKSDAKRLRDWLAELGGDESRFCAHLRIGSLEALPASRLKDAEAALAAKERAAAKERRAKAQAEAGTGEEGGT